MEKENASLLHPPSTIYLCSSPGLLGKKPAGAGLQGARKEALQ
jgi:hypothetical protein